MVNSFDFLCFGDGYLPVKNSPVCTLKATAAWGEIGSSAVENMQKACFVASLGLTEILVPF